MLLAVKGVRKNPHDIHHRNAAACDCHFCAVTKVPSKMKRVKKRVKVPVRQTGPGTMSLSGGCCDCDYDDYDPLLEFKILKAKRVVRRKNKILGRIHITTAS